MTADGLAEPGVKLSDKAYWEIEWRIITQELPPGHFLSERELAQQYNLGRTPVRESLQRLARAGLVRIVARRGVAVSGIDYRAEIEFLPVRRELLHLMARLAAEKRTNTEATGLGPNRGSRIRCRRRGRYSRLYPVRAPVPQFARELPAATIMLPAACSSYKAAMHAFGTCSILRSIAISLQLQGSTGAWRC